MPLKLPTLRGKLDQATLDAFDAIQTHANKVESDNAALQKRVSAIQVPTYAQIRNALSSNGQTPLNVTGLIGSTTAAAVIARGGGTVTGPVTVPTIFPPIPVGPPLPPGTATRYTTFQGLTVVTAAYGSLPWFGAALSSLSPADRAAVYAAELAAGDKYCIICLSWDYGEPGQPYGSGQVVPPRDMTGDLPGFRLLVVEIIAAGLIPLVFLPGDGEGIGGGGLGTYGHAWLMANLAAIVGALAGLLSSIVIVPGFDGCVPGWTPDEIDAYLIAIRALVGSARCVGLLLSAGYCHWGKGAQNYASAAGQGLDVILQQFEFGPYPANATDQIFQVAPRLINGAYKRPPEQNLIVAPNGGPDDPTPPYFLHLGTPRGPYIVVAFEFDTYLWVRSTISAAQVAIDRAYLSSVGYSLVG